MTNADRIRAMSTEELADYFSDLSCWPLTTNIYDTEEIHHGCTVQVLTNSVTGKTSVGWWKEKEGEE